MKVGFGVLFPTRSFTCDLKASVLDTLGNMDVLYVSFQTVMRILSMSDSETSRWVTRVHSCSRSVRPASPSVQVSTVSVAEYWAGLLKHLWVEHLAQGQLRRKQWKNQRNNVTELLTSWFRRSQSDTRAWIWPSFSLLAVFCRILPTKQGL